MRALLPTTSADVDLAEFYARDWLPRGGLRVNFISSVDGGSAVDGRSAGLQTDGDNRVFGVLRDQADVVLAGSGTVRAEGYEALHLPDERRVARTARDLSPVLPTAVVSSRLELDPSGALFDTRDDEPRTIVVTKDASDYDRRQALAAVADVVVAGDDAIHWPTVLDQLALRGLTRVLCEGGPGLFGQVASAGVLDELCLTVSPMLAGPGSDRIVTGAPWPAGVAPVPLSLAGLLEEDGALFHRYRRPSPGTISSRA